MNTQFVMNLVSEERINQDLKWGEQNHDPFTWLAILGEEVGEANRAALEARFSSESWLKEYAQELIQVAAVAIAMVESLERKKWAWPTSNNQTATPNAEGRLKGGTMIATHEPGPFDDTVACEERAITRAKEVLPGKGGEP